ncbi:putative polysaccharide biosynthesis protein [Asaccharospora irregularis]|uniref:Stage V sporulation protein B n=1 Tax=Asaccharospora irregularis DSM 2635 TaxID=1121321 RepID=A0A1M5S5E5_9FIRM|nr:polysaccharide biosynthesis protein [Asaccharospora irregularis]SHH33665.1 stage V sporulation protein B [Asaccharospora irregularis DSM 2635]
MNNNKKKDSFLKGALILGAAGVIVKILGAFFRIPLANLIGAEGMSYYQSVYPIYTLFLTIATAGFPTAVAKLVSEKVAVGDYKGANKVFKVSHTVLFVTGIIAFGILFFGAEYIVTVIIKNPEALYSMKAIAPALLFVPAMSAYRGYFQGRREMSKYAVSQIIEQVFRVILGLSLAYFLMKTYTDKGVVYGAAGAMFGATIGSVASITFLMIIYLANSRQRKLEMKASKNFRDERLSTIIKKLLVIAIPIIIGASVMPLVNLVDSVIVQRRLQEAGFTVLQAKSMFGQLTGMALTIINLPSVITTAMSLSLVPSIAEAYAIGNKAKARKDTKSAIKITLLIVLPAAFGLASLATPIMQLLYPKQPASIGFILLTLTPCVIFLGLMQTLTGILQGMGKPMIPVIALAVGMVFKVVISYTLTGIYDINVIGSALGTVVAYFIAAMINLIYVKKAMNIKFSKKEFFIKPLITVTTMFVVVKLSYGLVSKLLGNNIATLISIVIGGIVYVIVLLGLGGIRKEEILTMPKGEKIYKILKKLNFIR